MFKVLTCLTVEHDWRLVLLAVLICFLASLTAINLFYRARAASGRTRLAWLATAGAAAGCGIWATHFIAMLAYEPGIPIAYSVSLLALSLTAAGVVTGIGLAFALLSRARLAAMIGGGIVGGGVALMHYTGMWAMQVPGHVSWDPALVTASVALGIAFGMGALAIAIRRDESGAPLVAAVLLTLAIVSHHFTAMGAVEIEPDPTRVVDTFSLSPTALALAIAGAAIAVLCMSLAGAFADRRLREKDDQLATALNNMAQGLLMFDRDQRLILSNSRYLEMYGLSADDVKPGLTYRELVVRRKAAGSFFGDIDAYCAALVEAIVQGRTTSTVQRSPDGRTIHTISRPIAGGGWVATHEDVTERVSAQGERDRTRDLFNLVVENVPVTIFVKNAENRRYVLVNRACENEWGLSRSQILNKTAYDIFPKTAADAITEQDERLLNGSAPLVFDEHWIETARGNCFISSSTFVVPNPDDTGRYIVGVVEDMTERKLSEERLRQTQKMETIGNLTGGLAHDFNNLLTVILGNLDVLRELTSGNPAQKKLVDLVFDAGVRGAELTQQLLAFSRQQPLHPKLTNVAGLIEKTTRLLTRTLGENIRLEVETAPDAGSILVDEAQMQSALINIAVNARDAMSNGGTLTIKTYRSYINGQEANRPLGVPSGQYAVVEMRDSGCGMPPDVLARIFEPFFTTKPPGQGTGLGLSMVYGFVRQSGGFISAESAVGKGTTLKFGFPCSEISEARPVPEPVAPALELSAKTELILAVDDDPAVLATAVLQLEAIGYRTLVATNAEAALQVIDQHDEIDLLFTDVVMPGAMSGRELAKAARLKRPGIKVVYASGFPGTKSTVGGDMDLDAPLVAKPFRKNDLARVLDEVLRRPDLSFPPIVTGGVDTDWPGGRAGSIGVPAP